MAVFYTTMTHKEDVVVFFPLEAKSQLRLLVVEVVGPINFALGRRLRESQINKKWSRKKRVEKKERTRAKDRITTS